MAIKDWVRIINYSSEVSGGVDGGEEEAGIGTSKAQKVGEVVVHLDNAA